MADTVCVSVYDEPPFRMDEIMRYAGAGGSGREDILCLARECCGLVRGRLNWRVCWREFPLSFDGEKTDLGFARVASASLRRHLNGCDRTVLFAATVGLEMDRLIARYSAVSPARALMLQAVGAERAEALCGLFCQDVENRAALQGARTRPRFSPGYGDLPIELQKDIFRVLDCPARIGLTLNESLLMSPTKSVTAVIGLEPVRPDGENESRPAEAAAGCAECAQAGCLCRKERLNEDH